VAVVSAAFGIVKYKDEITANVLNAFKKPIKIETPNIDSTEQGEESIQPEASSTEEGFEQNNDQQLKEQLKIAEQKRLEAERKQQETERQRQEELEKQQEVARQQELEKQKEKKEEQIEEKSQKNIQTQQPKPRIASISLSASASSIFADGESIITIRAKVKDVNGDPVSNQIVYFSYRDKTIGSITDSRGVARINYTATHKVGSVLITAKTGEIQDTITIYQKHLIGFLKFDSRPSPHNSKYPAFSEYYFPYYKGTDVILTAYNEDIKINKLYFERTGDDKYFPPLKCPTTIEKGQAITIINGGETIICGFDYKQEEYKPDKGIPDLPIKIILTKIEATGVQTGEQIIINPMITILESIRPEPHQMNLRVELSLDNPEEYQAPVRPLVAKLTLTTKNHLGEIWANKSIIVNGKEMKTDNNGRVSFKFAEEKIDENTIVAEAENEKWFDYYRCAYEKEGVVEEWSAHGGHFYYLYIKGENGNGSNREFQYTIWLGGRYPKLCKE